MEKYILPIILSAFVIYLFCNRKKDLIEGAFGFLSRGSAHVSEDVARAVVNSERKASKFTRFATKSSERVAGKLSNFDSKLGSKFENFDGLAGAEAHLKKIMGEEHGITENMYNTLPDKVKQMIKRDADATAGFALKEGDERGLANMLNNEGEEFTHFKADGSAEDPALLATIENKAKKDTLYAEELKNFKGDLPSDFKLPSHKLSGKLDATADDLAIIAGAEAEHLGIATRFKNKITDFIKNHPIITAVFASGVFLYEILEAYKDTGECSNICNAGPPGSEDNPFSEWMETHDQDEYDEMCSGSSESDCETYCLAGPSGSGACSESAESERAINNFTNDVEAALIGGGTNEPDGGGGLLGDLFDFFGGIFGDIFDWKIVLFVVGTCCCLIISSFVTFVVYRKVGAKAMSTVANLKSSNSAFANDVSDFNQSIKLGGGGKVMNNKIIIIIIFFIFIIYNEWGRK